MIRGQAGTPGVALGPPSSLLRAAERPPVGTGAGRVRHWPNLDLYMKWPGLARAQHTVPADNSSRTGSGQCVLPRIAVTVEKHEDRRRRNARALNAEHVRRGRRGFFDKSASVGD